MPPRNLARIGGVMPNGSSTPIRLAAPSFNDLIRSLQERRWDREAEGLGGLEVDGELEFRRLLDRKISRLGASQNLVYIDRTTSRHLGDIHSIGHEATLLNKQVEFIDCVNPLLGRKIDNFRPRAFAVLRLTT